MASKAILGSHCMVTFGPMHIIYIYTHTYIYIYIYIYIHIYVYIERERYKDPPRLVQSVYSDKMHLAGLYTDLSICIVTDTCCYCRVLTFASIKTVLTIIVVLHHHASDCRHTRDGCGYIYIYVYIYIYTHMFMCF